jgi:uncharacterized protein (DUF111 family)
MADFLMTNSTTLGVRIHNEERIELARRKATLETPLGTVAIKIAVRPDSVETMSPEYESCKALAEAAGVPLIEGYQAAKTVWDKDTQTK